MSFFFKPECQVIDAWGSPTNETEIRLNDYSNLQCILNRHMTSANDICVSGEEQVKFINNTFKNHDLFNVEKVVGGPISNLPITPELERTGRVSEKD